MSELKACPFCNVNEWKYQSHFSGTTIYQCEKCGTIVEEWVINIRPIEDALQAENEWLKEELQQEKTRSQLNLEAEERRMLNITYYCAEIDRLNARIAELEAEVTKGHELQDSYCDRIAELEAENNRLAELLHNELSSVEIATDLGNKRWTALNKIYEDGEKHNTNWCKRIAQEGLGLK